MWYASGIGIMVLSVPAFALMARGWIFAIVGFLGLGLLLVLQLGTISATFPALFPTQVRYAGFAISYNLATSLFGGTAPLVNAFLIDKTGNHLMPAFYMVAMCAIGLVAVACSPETAGMSLRGTLEPESAKREVAPPEVRTTEVQT